MLVTNTPGVLTDATADLGMALILMVTRRLAEGERLIRSRQPWQWGMFMMLGTGLQGRRLGIIGMGAIGQALARRARAFEMEVVYHSRRPVSPELEAPTGARWVALDELLASSDVVSVNCPYNADTHHLIDAEALARMRSTAYLVNTARGPIVHERALADALRDGVIAGAALDVLRARARGRPRAPRSRQRGARAPPGLGDARDARRDGDARGPQRRRGPGRRPAADAGRLTIGEGAARR